MVLRVLQHDEEWVVLRFCVCAACVRAVRCGAHMHRQTLLKSAPGHLALVPPPCTQIQSSLAPKKTNVFPKDAQVNPSAPNPTDLLAFAGSADQACNSFLWDISYGTGGFGAGSEQHLSGSVLVVSCGCSRGA